MSTLVTVITLWLLSHAAALAQEESKNIKLHVNPRWKQCSFHLDPSLTQEAWHEFTEEAGLVAYFRPLVGARPMGTGNYELSILSWQTGIDDAKSAWNDTFVHPDSMHWLLEGDRLAFPGLMFRAGISERFDVGAYWTKNPGANYGFWGGHVQYAVVDAPETGWAGATRASVVSLYGPDDFSFVIVGMDFLASRHIAVFSGSASLTPYAGVSGYAANSHETTSAVDLRDEHVLGMQASIGTEAQISIVKIAAEYSFAKVHSLSFKLGVGF
jgi:prepilin-type processing-associated H-X9-DG protein